MDPLVINELLRTKPEGYVRLSSVTKGTWASKKPTYPSEGYVGFTFWVILKQKTEILVYKSKKVDKSTLFPKKPTYPSD